MPGNDRVNSQHAVEVIVIIPIPPLNRSPNCIHACMHISLHNIAIYTIVILYNSTIHPHQLYVFVSYISYTHSSMLQQTIAPIHDHACGIPYNRLHAWSFY